MTILNRLLSVLILLVAIAAVVVGVLLFNKRLELRERGNKMAQTLEAMAKTLDQNSGPGANFARRLDVTDDGRDGALGYSNYENLDSTLQIARQAATSVREQRDGLATALQNLANAMGLSDQVPAGSLSDLDGYADRAAIVAGYWNNVEERDEALIGAVMTLADLTGARITRQEIAEFGNRPGVDAALERVRSRVNQLNENRRQLAVALQAIAEAMGRDDLAARAENLTVADVEAIGDSLRRQREQLEDLQAARDELARVRANLADLQTAQETMHHNNQVLEQTIAQLNEQLRTRDERINQLQTLVAATTGGAGASRDLAGQIIDVNYEWNFVVINLGKAHDLPPRLEMTVARDSEFICKVLVRKVYKDYAVADIMSELKQGQPIEGDSVIYVASGL